MVLPDYGRGTLADILPSIAAVLGQSGSDNRLRLPASDRYVVFLVDGLGWDLLLDQTAAAPYLSGLAAAGRPLTSGVPSTTATSVASLGSGLVPGEHGVAGYSFHYPPLGGILNALTWAPGVDGLDVQPRLTAWERLAGQGIAVGAVMPARFRGSGLTAAALRGTRFHAIEDEEDTTRRVLLTLQAATEAPRAVVYVYERALDHTGHSLGCGSVEWIDRLSWVDALARRMRERLPDDVRLLITGDHGMIDIPMHARIVVEDEPDLLADVGLFGGEGRLRQLYVRGRAAGAVQRRWADRLGESAWVLTRDEAVDLGWFGPMTARLAPRFGDVLVAQRTDGAVMTRTLPNELSLVGMHGSLTSAEMRVPLLVD